MKLILELHHWIFMWKLIECGSSLSHLSYSNRSQSTKKNTVAIKEFHKSIFLYICILLLQHCIFCCKSRFCCRVVISSSKWLRPNYVWCIFWTCWPIIKCVAITWFDTTKAMEWKREVWYDRATVPATGCVPNTYGAFRTLWVCVMNTPIFGPVNSLSNVIESPDLMPSPHRS